MATTNDFSPRLSMPFISAAQAQKHVTINENFRVLDVLVQTVIEDNTSTTPPLGPLEGQAYIVADTSTGDWAGQDSHIAAYQDGAWAFFTPKNGWRAYNKATSELLVFTGSRWQALGGGLELTNLSDGTITTLGINTTSDSFNRLSVKTDAGFFSHDDVSGAGTGDIRIDFNKLAAGNTAAYLFKTNWTAHAEIGLAGDNKLRAKVSPDGTNWFTAWEVDETTGKVSFPNTTIGSGFLGPFTEFDDSNSLYIYTGWPDYDGAGNWLVRRQVKATGLHQNALTGAADFAAAWSGRDTLTFA